MTGFANPKDESIIWQSAWEHTFSSFQHNFLWELSVSLGCSSICFLTSQSKWIFPSCCGGWLNDLNWDRFYLYVGTLILCFSDCSRQFSFLALYLLFNPQFIFWESTSKVSLIHVCLSVWHTYVCVCISISIIYICIYEQYKYNLHRIILLCKVTVAISLDCPC